MRSTGPTDAHRRSAQGCKACTGAPRRGCRTTLEAGSPHSHPAFRVSQVQHAGAGSRCRHLSQSSFWRRGPWRGRGVPVPAAHGGFSPGVWGRGQGCQGMQRWPLHPEGPLQQGSAVSPPGPGPTAPGGQVPPPGPHRGWGGWGAPLAGVQGRRPPHLPRAPGPTRGLLVGVEMSRRGRGRGWGQVQAGRGEGGDPGAPQPAHGSSCWQLFS